MKTNCDRDLSMDEWSGTSFPIDQHFATTALTPRFSDVNFRLNKWNIDEILMISMQLTALKS